MKAALNDEQAATYSQTHAESMKTIHHSKISMLLFDIDIRV